MSSPGYLPILTMAPLVAFGMYRRVRRHVGAQLLRPRSLKIRIGFFAVIALLLLLTGMQGIPMAIAVIAGLLGGAALGLYSLRLTRFETRADGVYYTPNLFLGLALSALVLARVVYRMVVLLPQMDAAQAAQTGPPQLNPLTLALVALLIGYYLANSAGILRHPHARLPMAGNTPQA